MDLTEICGNMGWINLGSGCFCKYGNEIAFFIYIKWWQTLVWPSDWRLLKKDSLPSGSLFKFCLRNHRCIYKIHFVFNINSFNVSGFSNWISCLNYVNICHTCLYAACPQFHTSFSFKFGQVFTDFDSLDCSSSWFTAWAQIWGNFIIFQRENQRKFFL